MSKCLFMTTIHSIFRLYVMLFVVLYVSWTIFPCYFCIFYKHRCLCTEPIMLLFSLLEFGCMSLKNVNSVTNEQVSAHTELCSAIFLIFNAVLINLMC